MSGTFRLLTRCAIAVVGILIVGGCGLVEPRHGTRVVIELEGSSASRDKIAATSRYLMKRAAGALGATRARVASVTDGSLVLLLPGKRVSRKGAERLLETSSLEFYHLKSVSTKAHPNRPWRLLPRTKADSPYIFVGPNALRVTSADGSTDALTDIAGSPKEQPILTGKDVVPRSYASGKKRSWAVYVQFTSDGARTFHEFTKQNRGELIGVFYNGRLVSVPIISEPISGGEVFITGFRNMEEAQAAAEQINAGMLPVNARISSVSHY